jgi:hypothetical protein
MSSTGGIMFRNRFAVFILFGLLLLPEFAAATKMKSFWKNPEATEKSLQLQKVIVIVTIKHELTRKVAEDKAVRILQEGGREAVPSYTILTLPELENKEYAKSKVEAMGFDGAIVIHYAGSEDERKYYKQEKDWDDYNYFWGVYYPAAGAVYNSTTTNYTHVFIETMLYSFKENKLIWSGITETKNPKNPAKVVGEIAEETTKYLEKEGLIPKKK